MSSDTSLAAGDQAPAFTLPDQNGRDVSLSDFKGKRFVLFFYPKADTPGCTLEAQAFRDKLPEFRAKGVEIVGISPDSPKDQKNFCDKYDLPYTLLADDGGEVAQRFGVWGEKTMFGRTYFGVFRTTFVIGPDGVIERVFPNVSVEGHADEVLASL